MYKSIASKIMYLCIKLMVEGANASQELSSFFMHPKQEHWKALEHFVGYMKTKSHNIKLTYRCPNKLRFLAVADANFAQDKDKQRSISGGLYTLGGTIISCLSKSQ